MLVFSFRGIPAEVWRARYCKRTAGPARPANVETAAVVHAGLARAA